MSDPVELGPANSQTDLSFEVGQDPEQGERLHTFDIIRQAADQADEIAAELELPLPVGHHRETVEKTITAFGTAGFRYGLISDMYPMITSYRSYAKDRFGERIPQLLEGMLDGLGYFDGEIDYHDPDQGISRHNSRFIVDVVETESDHPQADTVRDALILAKFTGAINTYIRQRLDPLSHPGKDTGFMPKRLKTVDQVQEFWERTLVGDGKQVGILPANRLSGKYYRAMSEKLAEVQGIETQVLEAAIPACIFLKSSRSEKTSPVLRRPLLEAILSVDHEAIIQALEDIIATEPYVLTVPVGHLLDIGEDEVAELKSIALRNRGEAMKRAKVLKQEREMARIALEPVVRFDSSITPAKDFYESIEGRNYMSRDGLQLIEVSGFDSNTNLITINYLDQAEPGRDGVIKKRHAQRLPSFLLHSIMSGQWVEV